MSLIHESDKICDNTKQTLDSAIMHLHLHTWTLQTFPISGHHLDVILSTTVVHLKILVSCMNYFGHTLYKVQPLHTLNLMLSPVTLDA